MKINEADINHNAVKLIEEITEDYFDFFMQEDNKGHEILVIGQITGIIDMARAMKEMLEA